MPSLILTLLTAFTFAAEPGNGMDHAEYDHDGDHVPTIYESPDADADFTNDDTDMDGTPDYLDLDDDGDGLWTWPDEDVDGDGDPRNDDTDGDGIPDYLDADETAVPPSSFENCTCVNYDGSLGDFPDQLVDRDVRFESGSACSTLQGSGGLLWLLMPSLLMVRRRR